MNRYFSFSSVLCALFLLIIEVPAVAQDGPPQYIQGSVQAVEAMLKSEDEKSIDSFIKQSMVLSSDVDVNSLRKRLRKMRSEVKGLGVI